MIPTKGWIEMGWSRHIGVLCVAFTAVLVLASASSAAPPPPTSAAIPMKPDSGVYVVPVSVDGVVTFDCIVDSGASDVNIPEDAFRKLVRAGAIEQSDILGTEVYTLADGSNERGRVVRIRTLKVGNIVVHDVQASIGGAESNGLLGQSFLERFRSWSLDNERHALVLNGTPGNAPPRVASVRGPAPTRTRAPDDDGPADVAQIVAGHGDHGQHRRPPPASAADDGSLTAQTGH
ncbi:MAG TPA: retroviral-like aspartic protease family protein [Rhizomicrobium sp.]|nr:retroviral-like aspartic protease family protein [Rhizomicrobium sp.]